MAVRERERSPAEVEADEAEFRLRLRMRLRQRHRSASDPEMARYDWSRIARPEQLPPRGVWDTWLVLAGRGTGKTRTLAEATRAAVASRQATRIALVGDTVADVRDVMIQGDAGLIAVARPDERPVYHPSTRSVEWPNGTKATIYSAEDPDQLRGPAHDWAWVDELAKMKRVDMMWANLQMGMRVGPHPRVVAGTTPRPIKIVKTLVAQALAEPNGGVRLTRGKTRDNLANLSPRFVKSVVEPYEGTRLGRQELDAEILEDTEGALWTLSLIDRLRVQADEMPPLVRVVVSIDPAVTAGEESDETGLVVVGKGTDGHAYVLDDRSGRLHARDWTAEAVASLKRHRADRIVAEVNNGGDLVELAVRAVMPSAPYEKVHASRGKITRAEPVAALYEQGKVHHVGAFPALEDEMTSYVPGNPSPSRMDALVWAVTSLLLGEDGPRGRIAFGVARGW